MGPDGPGLTLAGLVRQAAEVCLSGRIGPSAEPGGCREGPCARRVAHLRPRGPVTRARRFLGALDQTAVGDNVLSPGAARDSVQRLAAPQAPDRADPWAGAPPGERVGVVRLGRVAARPLDVAAPCVRVAQPCEVDVETLRHSGSGTPLGHPVAGGCVGELLPHLGPVVLARGVLERRQPLGPCAQPMHPAPQQGARGAHRRRIHLGLWEQAPA